MCCGAGKWGAVGEVCKKDLEGVRMLNRLGSLWFHPHNISRVSSHPFLSSSGTAPALVLITLTDDSNTF